MNTISRRHTVLDVFRRQVAKGIGRLSNSVEPGDGLSARGDGKPPAPAEKVESIVRRRISALDRSSPESNALATRVFVESVLLGEFGEVLLADPGFAQMVGEVSASMREDPQLREQLDRLLLEF
jgi:hypothetical protein